MARITKREQLRLANNFALGASFIARGDLVTARMHANIAYTRLSLRPDEPEPAKVECDWPKIHRNPGERQSPWRYCPRCGVRLPEA